MATSTEKAQNELEENIIKHLKVTTGPSNDIYKLYQDSFKWINLQRARTLADFGTKLSFEKLLLKFPQIEEGFVIIENAFNGRALDADREPWDSSSKTITVEQARSARRALKFNASEEELKAMFHLGSEAKISVLFLDFVVALAILLIHLTPSKAKESGADSAAVETLALAISSFNHFDKDGNGSLAQEEVTGTLGEVDNSAHAKRTKEPGQGEAGDISKRWQLMDLNQDGRASFRDYIHSLHRWVLED